MYAKVVNKQYKSTISGYDELSLQSGDICVTTTGLLLPIIGGDIGGVEDA